MSGWSEQDSTTYADIADVAVPRRREMTATLMAAIPFASSDSFRIVELGSGQGLLAESLLDAFPAATLLALDRSELMRRETAARTARFGPRAVVRAFELEKPDWWDWMAGADLVASSLCLHHLNDAKTQYLYKAAAARTSSRGGVIVADLIDPVHADARRIAAEAWDTAAREQAQAMGRPEIYARFVQERWNHFRFPDPDDTPSALFHHLVWLRHAGFSLVDCIWLFAGHAVFGGFKGARSSNA